MTIHGITYYQFTYKGLLYKTSNAILTLKHSLQVSDIDGVKHLLQMIHSLCHKSNVETFCI